MRWVQGLLLLTMACRVAAFADSPAEQYNHANELYNRKQFAQAAAEYQRLLDSGVCNGYLYFNLGNAYYQLGKVGQAVLCYERARRLLPRDEQVAENLRRVRALLPDEIELTAPGSSLEPIAVATQHWSVNELGRLLSAFYMATLLALMVVLLLPPGRRRRAAQVVAGLCGVLAVMSALVVAGRLLADAQRGEAVVIVEQVDVRTGPSTAFETAFQLHEGATVIIDERRGGWAHVFAGEKLKGWLRTEQLERI